MQSAGAQVNQLPDVSTFRLYLMRATYLLIVVGLGVEIWPALLQHAREWDVMRSAACSMLAAASLLALLGIRYPLKLVPLLLFELTWKSIWLLLVALPMWLDGQIEPRIQGTLEANLMGLILFPLVIPWPYVYASFVKARGDRWKRKAKPT